MTMERSWKVQYWATLAVALAGLTSSVSFSWTTPVLPKFHNNETTISLSETEISWLLSSTAPGTMAGSLVSRYPAERFGRRATLLGSAFPFILGTIFIVTATKAWMLYLARFSWGLGSGIIQSVAMIYVAEIAAKEIRGKLSVFNRFVFSFGAFLVIIVGSVTSYQTLSYMLIVLPVCYFGACWFVPETPYHLLKVGRVAAAKKSLMKLNGYKDKNILDEKFAQMQSHVKEDMNRAGTVKELFTGKHYRNAIMISIGLRTTQTMSGTIPLQHYIGRILQETNSNISISTGLILFAAVRMISSMLASIVVDKVGRRPLIIMSYLGFSLTLIVLGVLFFLDGVMGLTPSSMGYITLVSLILSTAITTLGFNTTNFVVTAEIFPLNVKSTAMTVLNIYIAVMGFIVVRGYQILKDFSGMHGVCWFYGSVSLAGAIFSYIAVPETKGKSLREIQLQLQGDLYDDACAGAGAKLNENTEDVDDVEVKKDFEKVKNLCH